MEPPRIIKFRIIFILVSQLFLISIASSHEMSGEENLKFLSDYSTSIFTKDQEERDLEKQIQLSQIGHYLVSRNNAKNTTLLYEHFSKFKVITSKINEAFLAIVGTHRNNKTLIVTFRGTFMSLQNVLADVIIFKKELQGPKSCGKLEVTEGFDDGLNQIKDEIFKEIKEQTLENNYSQVIFSGHSLGAAMTNIAAVEYIKRKEEGNEGFQIPRISLVTFGGPRVGTQTFADCLTKNTYHNFRVIYGKDLIPSIPWKRKLNNQPNFTHSGTEIRYVNKKFNEPHLGPKDTDSSEDGWGIMTALPDHLSYKYIDSKSIWEAIHTIDK